MEEEAADDALAGVDVAAVVFAVDPSRGPCARGAPSPPASVSIE